MSGRNLTERWLDRLWQLVVFWSLAAVALRLTEHIEAEHTGSIASGVLLAWGAVEGIKAWRGERAE